MTIGLDLGDEYTQCCVLDENGRVVEQGRIRTTPEALKSRFGSMPRTRIALEAGVHSAWSSRLLGECGHEVIVANPRKLRLIYKNDQKDDEVDAENLARVARLDPQLLYPIQHRSVQTQQDLAVLRARDEMVQARTQLINHIRGAVKSMGGRIPKMSAEVFGSKAAGSVPEALKPALGALLSAIQLLTKQIRQQDQWVQQRAKEGYPQSAALRQVPGVGPLTSVAYVLTLEDPKRFASSRRVGAYLGLRPKRATSGASDPQLRISKAGDGLLRRLLVGSAHYILGPFGPDTDLRRWGQKIAQRGGKNAKKRAVVAVSRKLAVLLHRLWMTQEKYDPQRNSKRKKPGAVAEVLGSPLGCRGGLAGGIAEPKLTEEKSV